MVLTRPSINAERMILGISGLEITDEFFLKFSQQNPDIQMERRGKTELIIMPPTFTKTGKINFQTGLQLGNWNEKMQLGEVFDSSTGFTLPDDSVYSPDVSWIRKDRWEALTKQQQENEFAPICPDFVIEIRSKSDRLKPLQQKMQDWLANGCEQAWLIDIAQEKVYIYQKGKKEVKTVNSFQEKISAPELLPAFELDLTKIIK